MQTVTEQVKDIIVEELGIVDRDRLSDDATFEALDADSLDQVELVMAFEHAFEIDILEEEADTLRTVGDAVALIQRKVAR